MASSAWYRQPARRRAIVPKASKLELVEPVRALRAAGLSNPEIGKRLDLDPGTVRNICKLGGIAAYTPAKTGETPRTAPRVDPDEVVCPSCGLVVDILRGKYRDHRGLSGERVGGVYVTVLCPMAGEAYKALAGVTA